MKESINKILKFNGKSIYFLAVDGKYYILQRQADLQLMARVNKSLLLEKIAFTEE